MIDELLKMHDVDYIISVDDCYSIENDLEFAKTSIFAMWNSNIERIDSDIAVSAGKTELWNEYKMMLIPENDNTVIISDFINSLGEEDIYAIYEKLCSQNNNSDFKEKNRLITFLDNLKNLGYIKDFYTYSSTKSALDEYPKLETGSSGILWLIDNDFSRVGEASDAGLTLAQNLIDGKDSNGINYIFILSSLNPDNGESEDDIEEAFDNQLQGNCNLRTASFIYYLYKQRINSDDMNRIAKSLAHGFKRKVCYQIFENYIYCMKKGAVETEKNLYKIKQNTLNFLFSERIPEEGESIWEFLIRFVDLFMQDEYKNALAEKYTEFARSITYYKELSKIVSSPVADKKAETELVKQYRKKEIYDFFVNKLHLEVTTGDIFKIDDKYYILISQACDSCLRADGKRVLKNASLLLISNTNNGIDQFKYDLKVPLTDDLTSPIVDFKNVRSIPFELIDLCVLNDDGRAVLSLNKTIQELLGTNTLFEDRFTQRMVYVNKQLNQIVTSNRILEQYFDKSQDHPIDRVREAFNDNKLVTPELLGYRDREETVIYNIQRICRLQEILAIHIVRKYGNNVSRIGTSFDFSGKPPKRSTNSHK